MVEDLKDKVNNIQMNNIDFERKYLIGKTLDEKEK